MFYRCLLLSLVLFFHIASLRPCHTSSSMSPNLVISIPKYLKFIFWLLIVDGFFCKLSYFIVCSISNKPPRTCLIPWWVQKFPKIRLLLSFWVQICTYIWNRNKQDCIIRNRHKISIFGKPIEGSEPLRTLKLSKLSVNGNLDKEGRLVIIIKSF